jgi:DNA-binding LacI/PurR family transcriptional regulator
MGAVMFAPPVRRGKGGHSLRILLPTVCRRIGTEGGSWWLDRMADGMRARLALSDGHLAEQHFRDIESLLAELDHQRHHGVVLRQPLPTQWIEQLRQRAGVVYAIEFDHQCGVDSVYSNEHRSTAMAIDVLSRHGHRDIAWLGILDRHAPYQVVHDAATETAVADRQAFSVHGARHAAWANLVYCQFDRREQQLVLVERDWRTLDLDGAVAQGLERVLALKPRPTAIVCSCDPVALSLLTLLATRGLRVPRDMSVMSFGGSDEVKAATPSVTCLEMPMHMIGRVIPELIERRMVDPKAVPISVQFEATLSMGDSVAAVPSHHVNRIAP